MVVRSEFLGKKKRRVPIAGPGEQFRQLPLAQEVIPGFSSSARTESVLSNFAADFSDMIDGYNALGGYIQQEGLAGVGEIARQMPAAFVESYARWKVAADRGQFSEMVRKHPLEFVQDMTLPLSVLLGGAGVVTKTFGVAGQSSQKVATVLGRMGKVADAVGIASDPIGGTVSAGLSLGFRTTLKNVVDKPKLPESKILASAKGFEADRLLTKGERIRQQGFNELYSIDKLGKLSGDPEGGLISGAALGIGNKIANFVGRKPFSFDTKLPIEGASSLTDVLGEVGVARSTEFAEVATMLRAAELESRGLKSGVAKDSIAEVLQKQTSDPINIDALTGKNARTEINRLIDSPNFDPAMRSATRKYQSLWRATMQYATEAGLIDIDTARKVASENEFYSPFVRTGFGKPGSPVGKPVAGGGLFKKFKGSERGIVNPIETAPLSISRIIREAEVNRSTRTLAELANVPGGFIKPFTRGVTGTRLSKGEFLKALDMADDGMGDLKGTIGADFNDLPTIFRPQQNLPENVFGYIDREGKRKFIEVNDPDLQHSISTIGFNSDPNVLKSAFFVAPKTAKNVFRAGVILTPAFAAKNTIRDNMTAWINSNYGFKPGYDWGRGIITALTQRGDLYDGMAARGAFSATMVGSEPRQLLRIINENLKLRDPTFIGRLRNIAKFTVTNPLRFMEKVSEVTEMGTRFGAAQRALDVELKRGLSQQQALDIASREFQEISVDFRRRGANDALKIVQSMAAFSSAGMAGIGRTMRELWENPKRVGYKGAIPLITGSVLLYMHNMHDEEYKDLPRWEKDMFWHVRPVANSPMLRIPKPFEYGLIFGSVFERVAEYMFEDDPSVIAPTMARALEMFVPEYMPTMAKPFLETWGNKSFFFEQPLTTKGQERLPVSQQANAGTTEFSRLISNWMERLGQYVPGGTPGKPKEAAFSPIEIDNIVFGLTGTLGKQVGRTVDDLIFGSGAITGVEPPTPKGGVLGKIPLVNTFLSNKNKASQARSDFFEINEALQKKANNEDFLKGKERARFRQDNQKDLRDAKVFKNRAKSVYSLLKQQRVIRANPSLSAKRKRELIDRLDIQINRIAQNAVQFRRG